MSPDQIKLVKQSWGQVAPIKERAAALFYERLFELDPSLQLLFRNDMAEQGRKLMTMIDAAVNALNDLPSVVPAVRALGARHAGYGVKNTHYETVGQALLWTLERGLGSMFTVETREAWVTVYKVLSSTMIEAADQYAQADVVRQGYAE